MRDVQRLAVVVAVAVLVVSRLDAPRRAAAPSRDPARVGPHLGYNFDVIGGWEVRRSPVTPYAEGHLVLGHGSAFQVAGGISFDLH